MSSRVMGSADGLGEKGDSEREVAGVDCDEDHGEVEVDEGWSQLCHDTPLTCESWYWNWRDMVASDGEEGVGEKADALLL
jgi:hypothetical protein